MVGLNIVSKASLSGLTVIAMYQSTALKHDDNLSRRKRRGVRSSSGARAGEPELFFNSQLTPAIRLVGDSEVGEANISIRWTRSATFQGAAAIGSRSPTFKIDDKGGAELIHRILMIQKILEVDRAGWGLLCVFGPYP